MYKIILYPLAVLTLILTLNGCTNMQPIDNIYGQSVPKGLTNNQIQLAILNAASNEGWIAQQTSPGVIVANYKSKVKVTITYSSDSYNIAYDSSEGIEQNNGKISEEYNNLVNKLNSTIKNNLNSASTTMEGSQKATEAGS